VARPHHNPSHEHGPEDVIPIPGAIFHIHCSVCGEGGPFMGDTLTEIKEDVARWVLAERLGEDEDWDD
jgi:hypothetical protein